MSTPRKEILLRKQKGKTILPKWKTALEEAINQSVSLDSFLDIGETEQLRADFFDKVRLHNHEHQFVTKDNLGKMLSELHLSIARYGGRRVVVFHSNDKYIGALQVDAEVIAHALEAIWRVVEEDLCVATIDLSGGFCFETNYYDEFGEYVPDGVFELTAWGDFALR
jgi:hypothetical protein